MTSDPPWRDERETELETRNQKLEAGSSNTRPPAYCLLPTAYCLLPTAYCLLLFSTHSAFAECNMFSGKVRLSLLI